MQSLNGGRNNDKYVFEKLKKEINQFLISRKLRPIEDADSKINYDEFNNLLDELGFVIGSKIRASE